MDSRNRLMLHTLSGNGFLLITALFLCACQPLTAHVAEREACPDGLIAYWKLDEGEGELAHDAVGDNDGVIHNGASWVPGMVGSALSFDGEDDRVRLPSDVISGDTLTVNLWLKTDDNYFSLITGANDTFDNEYGLVYFGRLWLGYHDAHSSNTYYTNIRIDDGAWHMISVVSEPSGTRFYIDGKLREESDPPFGTKDEFRIEGLWIGGDQDCVDGCWSSVQQFKGIVDEIAIYHVALSSEEIEQHYNRIMAGKSYCDP